MPPNRSSDPLSRRILRIARRLAVLVVGATLCAVGTVLLFLPVPGSPVILAGLAVLATEFSWADRRLQQVKTRLRARRGVVAAERTPAAVAS